jgi:hypothetical protein
VCVYYCSTYYKAVRAGGGSGGHVLRETTSRGLCGLVCPSRTSERGGEGDCVKEEGEEKGSARGSVHWGRERVLFIGTQFSILYTSMYSPAEAATSRA